MITDLKSITDIIGDGLHGTPQYDENGQYYFINGNNLNETIEIKSDTKRVNEEEFKKHKKPLNKNTILLSINGTLGNFARYNGEPVILGKSACYINIKQGYNVDYISWFLKSKVREDFERNATGTTIKNISLKQIRGFQINLPDEAVQEKISRVLNSIQSKIDVNTQINRNLSEQAVAIFKEKIWAKEKNGVIGDYCDMKSGYAFKSAWWTDEGIKVIKIGDINQDNLNLSICSHVSQDKIEKASMFRVVAGDLVIAMTGATIGKFAMVPDRKETILVNQRVGKFFLGNEPLNRVPFIYCTLKMDEVFNEVIGRGQGSAQPNISAGDVMSIPCVIPSQEEIDEFNSLTTPMFTQIVKNQNENEQLANLRDSLLPKLMSGELDVSDLDI